MRTVKVTAQFEGSVSGFARYLRTAIWYLSVIAVGGSLWFSFDAMRLHDKAFALEKQLAGLMEGRGTDVAGLPAPEDISRIKDQVDEVNALFPGYRGSLSVLLSKLEELLPDDIYLIHINYKPRLSEMQLVAEGDQLETLARFLHRLERDRSFDDVLLTKQTHRKSKGMAKLQFHVSIRLGET